MKKRQLGKNGPLLTEIGLGTWAMGGPWQHGWGQQEEKDSIAAIRKSLEMGINWVDTAAVYGLGESEKVLAKALHGQRDSVFIATKCGLRWDDSGNVRRDSSPASIRSEVEQSLRRLRTDYIDLYQIHWPDKNVPIQKSWEEMTHLQEEQKVRFIGVSNYNLEEIRAAMEVSPVASLQSPFSLVNRYVEREILPFLEENGIGFLAYSPMQAGLLTGKFSPENVDSLDDGDWRKKNKYFQEPLLSRIIHFTDSLRPIAEKYGMELSQLALRWTLDSHPFIHTIAGARNPSQAASNSTSFPENPAEDMAKIEDIYRSIIKED